MIRVHEKVCELQDYKSPGVAVMIRATLVNRYTDTDSFRPVILLALSAELKMIATKYGAEEQKEQQCNSEARNANWKERHRTADHFVVKSLVLPPALSSH